MNAPHTLSAVDALTAIASGTLTAEALMRACLERIAERELAIHAFAWLDPARALDEARASDRTAAGSGGPLRGLPIGVKDIIDTHDMPTQCGSPIYEGHRPPNDASCVALAREAGAVMLGKTVTTEFALRHPGPTANPRNPLHTPGGSSSGSAAAVADFMVPVAFGTQTGGSIIRPASYCGVVGYKPSFGTINPTGVKPLANSFDTVGLFARCVDDCALIIGVLSGGFSGVMPGTMSHAMSHAMSGATRGTMPSPMPALQAMRPARIGLCRTHAWPHAEPPMVAAVEAAAAMLSRAGVIVDDVNLSPEFADFADAQNDVLRFEAARVFAFERTRHPDKLSMAAREELAAGLALSHVRYLEAQALIARCRAMFGVVIEPYDFFLSASAAGEAPRGLHNTGEAMFNRLTSGLHVPCLSLPGYTGSNGLPLGIQLIGAMGNDAALLRNAKWMADRLLATPL